MRILYLAPEIAFPGSHGGATHVEGKIASLTRLGHDIIVLSRTSDKRPLVERHSHLVIYRLPLPSMSILSNLLMAMYNFLFALFFCIVSPVGLVYERGRIFGGAGILAAWLCGVRSVYELNEPHVDLPLFHNYSEASPLYRLALGWHRCVVNRATLVTVTHESLITQGIAPKKKTMVIVHGVDTTTFSPAPSSAMKKKYHLQGKFVVLYTGSFSPWHALRTIVDAARKLISQKSHILFFMVGDGVEYNNMRALVASQGVEHLFRFTGKVPFQAVPSYIACSDVCLALFDRTYPPFKKYSFFYSPMKLTEYMASGKPVIASSFGTLKKHIISGKNGFLINESSSSQLVQALEKMIKQKATTAKMGRLNRKTSEEVYQWDSINAQILQRVVAST